jgi:hypothetical protein
MLSLSVHDEQYKASVSKVAHTIASKGKVIIISGAGISVSSGIPVTFFVFNIFLRISALKMDSTIKLFKTPKAKIV